MRLSSALRLLNHKAKKVAKRMLPDSYKRIRSLRATILRRKNFSPLEICYPRFPSTYHFLMTNYCNVECIFCNQRPGRSPNKEITFDKFKAMLSHIPLDSAKLFCFTGGGEPLLCPDLFQIIRHVNINYPSIDISIRTNGLLIEKYAKLLSELNITRLEISIHGVGKENDYIVQREGAAGDVFRGIAILNNCLKSQEKEIVKVFCPIVSRLNISALPELIRKASELKVNEIIVEFCRYFPYRVTKKLSVEDSLYLHKELYNTVIRKAKTLARTLGVHFEYDALFGYNFRKLSCLLPWEVMLIDPDADVFPCCGGEEWFGEKVKSGRYYFGNVLREHVSKFWNNDMYIKIRKTCALECNEPIVPECKNCHRAIKINGSDNKYGHIINANHSQPANVI